MRPLHAVVMGALGLAVLAAGCGEAIPSSNGGRATVRTASSNDGRILVDGEGHTLYLFAADRAGKSSCSGACAAVWPAVETDSMPQAAAGAQGGRLGTTKRGDGETQVTYNGHPLYYYAADASTPGKTEGQDVDQFGAAWYLVNAHGSPVESKSGGPGSGSHPSSGSGSMGGGY